MELKPYQRRVNYYETDQMGIAHHSNYLRYFEEARLDLMRQMNCSAMDLEKIGPKFEAHECFPNRTNTEFVKVLDRTHLSMRVWERGSGETLACGTGACAALAAAVKQGFCEREAAVRLLGGELRIRWSQEDKHIYMTGPARTVFEGERPDDTI